MKKAREKVQEVKQIRAEGPGTMVRLKLNRRSALYGDRGGPPHQLNKRDLGEVKM